MIRKLICWLGFHDIACFGTIHKFYRVCVHCRKVTRYEGRVKS